MTLQKLNYEMIEELRSLYPVTWLLEISCVKRSSYYKWRATQSSREAKVSQEQDIREHIMGIHFLHPEFGYPRITDWLNEDDFVINHKKVYRLMKELGIQSVIRKKRKRHGH